MNLHQAMMQYLHQAAFDMQLELELILQLELNVKRSKKIEKDRKRSKKIIICKIPSSHVRFGAVLVKQPELPEKYSSGQIGEMYLL